MCQIEQFLNKCRKTKTKEMTLTNHNRNKMNQSKIEANTSSKRQARQNACEQFTIGFGLSSDWLRKWRELFYPIRERSEAEPKQIEHYFRHSFENCFTCIGT